jgi:hypothetical protein
MGEATRWVGLDVRKGVASRLPPFGASPVS